MRQFSSGDAWADGELRRAEEALALARAFTAEGRLARAREVLSEGLTPRPALVRDSPPPRRGARVWLGEILLAAGQRLLRSVPRPEAPA